MTAHAIGRRRHHKRKASHHRLPATAVVLAATALVAIPVAYMVWPRPAPVSIDAPSVPIEIGSEIFNVPPAAIRMAVQRRPGPQGRVDLVFLWPSLQPPERQADQKPGHFPTLNDRVFVTIAVSDDALAPVERLRTIYPRYTDGLPIVRSDGLTVRRFKTDTPYAGEDLMYDGAAPARFLLRCSRADGAAPGTCLHEQRLPGGADITVRFPRQWLTDWQGTAAGIERLIASLRPGHN